MGYVITGASGLALGVALLIWALIERSKRADAEKLAIDTAFEARQFREACSKLTDALTFKDSELKRAEAANDALRAELDLFLAKCTSASSVPQLRAMIDALEEKL